MHQLLFGLLFSCFTGVMLILVALGLYYMACEAGK